MAPAARSLPLASPSLSLSLCQETASGATWETSQITEWTKKKNPLSHKELICGTMGTASCNLSLEHKAKNSIS